RGRIAQPPAPQESQERRDALQMIAMLNDPQRQETARRMMGVLSTPGEINRMLQLMGSRDHQQDAQALMTMLANPRNASTARAILNNLTEPRQIHQMLELMGNQEQARAVQSITQMLQSENPRGAVNLLNGLTSTDAGQRQTAQRMLEMLNHNE